MIKRAPFITFVITCFVALSLGGAPARAATLTDSQQAQLKKLLVSLSNCEIFYTILTLAHAKAGNTTTPRYRFAVKSAKEASNLVYSLSSSYLSAKDQAALKKFTAARLESDIKKYKPYASDALGRLYSSTMKGKENRCQILIDTTQSELNK